MIDCRSCGSGLTELFSLGDIFLNEFRYDDKLPPQSPLALALCSECSLVQLTKSVDPKLIYTDDYGFESGINNTIRADLAQIIESAKLLVDLEPRDIVIDIGCNDGTLLSNYGDDIFKIGFDPVKKYAIKSRVFADRIYPTFFTSDVFDIPIQAKVVTSISMFYDLEDPDTFCKDIFKVLSNDGIWIVQQNYLYSMLGQNAYDNIVHQHVEYYSMHSMTHLLERNGFRIFHVEQNNVNGGSFRTYICKADSKRPENTSVFDLLEAERKAGQFDPNLYANFYSRIQNEAISLNELVNNLYADGKLVYVYGASTRGDTLLQFSGLNNTLLPFAVERNPAKYGKKISSLQIPIISEEEARENKPDYMLVLPWFFFDEFKYRESEYLSGGGKFIVPLPTLRIFSTT